MLDTIRKLLDRRPFEPFRIVVTSGDRYEVPDPHLIAILESQVFYAHPKSDRFSFIRVNQIVSADLLQSAA
ncbi:MAG: hypothetical protein JXQ73_23475 [Phycisphaerae bacterium]|nr:hypothetical protein [Phycisphaerae bacterium]